MRRFIILGVVLVILVGGGLFALNRLQENARYVTTDNATIAAPLIAVTNLGTGQVVKVNVKVGDRVEQQQTVAEVGTPRYADASARQGFSANPGSGATIQAPVSGYVAAVWTYAGALVSPGTPIVTLFDDSNIWINANIDENKISSVRPGQPAEVTVDSLGNLVLKGKVQSISPSTAASFSLLPQNNTTGNYIKVAQVIPVRISLENISGLALIPGSSAEVKILVK